MMMNNDDQEKPSSWSGCVRTGSRGRNWRGPELVIMLSYHMFPWGHDCHCKALSLIEKFFVSLQSVICHREVFFCHKEVLELQENAGRRSC